MKGKRKFQKLSKLAKEIERNHTSTRYSEEIMYIIGNQTDDSPPFFVYMAPFTKSYPWEANGEEEYYKNRRAKITALDTGIGVIYAALNNYTQVLVNKLYPACEALLIVQKYRQTKRGKI